MNREPTTKHFDVLYVDLLLDIDKLVTRVEKAKSRKFPIFCFIFLIFVNVGSIFLSIEYIEYKDRVSLEKKSAEAFLESFENLSNQDRSTILKLLKKGA